MLAEFKEYINTESHAALFFMGLNVSACCTSGQNLKVQLIIQLLSWFLYLCFNHVPVVFLDSISFLSFCLVHDEINSSNTILGKNSNEF